MDNSIKTEVRNKYGAIAKQSKKQNVEPCCCGSKTEFVDFSIMSEDYRGVDGYAPEADLGLGCGLPTEFANIQRGDRVIDLGSGAGNDAFIARKIVGENGFVVGVDFTEEMIEKARENCKKLKFDNVEFRLGDIENAPVDGDFFDVALSNCVLNLAPDKKKAFKEIFRVLKPGGNLCVSDIVLTEILPDKLREPAEMYAGCVAGALMKDDYIHIIKETGFENINIVKEKDIVIPEHILSKYLSKAEIVEYQKKDNPVKSVTVYAEKKRLL